MPETRLALLFFCFIYCFVTILSCSPENQATVNTTQEVVEALGNQNVCVIAVENDIQLLQEDFPADVMWLDRNVTILNNYTSPR